LTKFSNHQTARSANLALCHDCHKLVSVNTEDTAVSCPRCGADIHFRKPNSINHTWALVLTALVLSFPANLLPIMQVNFMGTTDLSTIMDGIIYFFREGSYGIGLVILTASILVPWFKIIGLILILLSIRFRWQSWLKHKALLFRIIEFIGRWSMLDIFVIALLQVLVTIMQVNFMGTTDLSTIMDGIIYFFREGSYGIGLVILTASILVPWFKIIGLILILLSIRFRWQSWLKHKALLFRIIEFIGRWSMLDIFVIALLQVLVNFGSLTTISAAVAAPYFTGVVLSTMFAAITFDPRLLWDS